MRKTLTPPHLLPFCKCSGFLFGSLGTNRSGTFSSLLANHLTDLKDQQRVGSQPYTEHRDRSDASHPSFSIALTPGKKHNMVCAPGSRLHNNQHERHAMPHARVVANSRNNSPEGSESRGTCCGSC